MPARPLRRAAVAILGRPGAGKGTVARRLQAEHGFQHVDMGHLLRTRARRGDATGRRIAVAQARGTMAPKEVVLEVLADALGDLPTDAVIVLDGFPRTTAQVAATDDGRVAVDLQRAVLLDLPATVATERLRRRAAHSARPDDRATVVEARMRLAADTVDAVCAELARRGVLEVVDARGSEEEVFSRVVACMAPFTARA